MKGKKTRQLSLIGTLLEVKYKQSRIVEKVLLFRSKWVAFAEDFVRVHGARDGQAHRQLGPL